MKVNYQCIKSIDRDSLEKIDYRKYDFVVVQSSYDVEEEFSEDFVDDKSIMIILNLRDIKNKDNHSFKIVSELFDSNNHDLIQNSQIDDFILSEKFISSTIAQVSENKNLSKVLEKFLDERFEIYLRAITEYVNISDELDFFDISYAAQSKNEIAIGYKLNRFINDPTTLFNGKEHNFGIVINPIKNKPIAFTEKDQIIVLASD